MITILTLVTGYEVVGEVLEVTESSVTLDDPCIIKTLNESEDNTFSMMPYSLFTKKISFAKRMIISSSEDIDPEMIDLYRGITSKVNAAPITHSNIISTLH